MKKDNFKLRLTASCSEYWEDGQDGVKTEDGKWEIKVQHTRNIFHTGLET